MFSYKIYIEHITEPSSKASKSITSIATYIRHNSSNQYEEESSMVHHP